MIFWEEESLNDREKLFEFLYVFNPDAAERADQIIEEKVEHLLNHPFIGVELEGVRGRLLIIPEVSVLVPYWTDEVTINVMRVLHQKQKFPKSE